MNMLVGIKEYSTLKAVIVFAILLAATVDTVEAEEGSGAGWRNVTDAMNKMLTPSQRSEIAHEQEQRRKDNAISWDLVEVLKLPPDIETRTRIATFMAGSYNKQKCLRAADALERSPVDALSELSSMFGLSQTDMSRELRYYCQPSVPK